MVRKTKSMRALEARHGAPLETLIVTALSKNARDSDAAGSLGILPTTLSHWISKLQIHNEAEEARLQRLDKSTAA